MEGDDSYEHSYEQSCIICEGPCTELGRLGARAQFRCRDCGSQFSRVVPEEAQESR